MNKIMVKRINMINFRLDQFPEQIDITDKWITDEELQSICTRIDSKNIKEIQLKNQKRMPKSLTYKAMVHCRDSIGTASLLSSLATTILVIKDANIKLKCICLISIEHYKAPKILSRGITFIQGTMKTTKCLYDIFYSIEVARKLDQIWWIQLPNQSQLEELVQLLYVKRSFEFGVGGQCYVVRIPLKVITIASKYLANNHQTINQNQIQQKLKAKFPNLTINN